ncbi:MAG: metal-dependent transcriptional regulator [Candidatus Hydrogenedens sp.]|nr:metal-dependent transcriptional regulator [Candidatus Hydrogenedens sp.]
MEIHRLKYPKSKKLTHSRIHYLWAIQDLNERNGFARATDVASLLGVSRSAVCIALSHLKELNWVVEKLPHRYLELTNRGKKQLAEVNSNFNMLCHFFYSYLQLDKETATKQACLIEHLILDKVAKKMTRFIEDNSSPSSFGMQNSTKNIGETIND